MIVTPHGNNVADKLEDPYHVREYNQEEFRKIMALHFSHIRWFGRRQGARLKAVEWSMDGVRQFNPGGLRNVTPRPVRDWLGGLVGRLQGGPSLKALIPEDIEWRKGVASDTNLIGICIK